MLQMLNEYYVQIAIVSGSITSMTRINKNLDFHGRIIMGENRKRTKYLKCRALLSIQEKKRNTRVVRDFPVPSFDGNEVTNTKE